MNDPNQRPSFPEEPSSPPARPVNNLPPPYVGPFSLDAVFAHGWNLFKRHYGILLGGSAIVLGISFALSLLENIVNAAASPLGSLISLASSFFLMPVLQTGLTFMAARGARGEAIAFDHMFDGFRRYWPLVGVNALLAAIYAAIAAPVVGAMLLIAAFAGGPDPLVIVAAGVLLLAVFLAVYPRLTFAPVICLDPVTGEGAVGSIGRSWRITAPYWGPLVALHLLLGLMVVGSVFLLCIGVLLLGVPLAFAITGAAYAAIVQPTDVRSHCRNCGYDLARLNTRVCPECGTMASEEGGSAPG